jgi:hypothetical protein
MNLSCTVGTDNYFVPHVQEAIRTFMTFHIIDDVVVLHSLAFIL